MCFYPCVISIQKYSNFIKIVFCRIETIIIEVIKNIRFSFIGFNY